MKTEKAHTRTVETPAGDYTFAVNDVGAVVYARFEEGDYPVSVEDELPARGFYPDKGRGATEPVAQQLREYTNGERHGFDLVLAPAGTEWQLAVWAALRKIPFGQTRTYSELAGMIGSPGAARAAGRANAMNRIPLIVPCHRVVGANGSLTGFAGGVHLKERLLAHERLLVGESG